MSTTTDASFASLQGENFIRLTTFRKSGKPVPTPVWFAQDGDRLVVTTSPNSGKIKRMRHTPRVELIASDARGNPKEGATTIEAQAHILPESEYKQADKALSKKYGWQKTALMLMGRLRGSKSTYFEITA
ncbi:MAG: PPOX class F420-dependent enzyme [Anaerolineaceae bacterium]|nr:PPOX class F420-dependent enzyme [Anaerolineaceae bacterium]